LWKLDVPSNTLVISPYRFVEGMPIGSGIVSADIMADGTIWLVDGRLGPGRMGPDGRTHFLPEHARMEAVWRFIRFDMYGTGWVTHQHDGLYRLSGDGSLELVLAASGAEHICVTPDRIAVASGYRGGLMWDLTKQAPIAPLDEQRGMPTNRINCLFRDKDGNTWIGTQDGLIQLVNPGVEHVLELAGRPFVELEGIARAADGSLWVASRTEGLLKLAPETGVFQPESDMRWVTLMNGQDERLYALEDRAWYRYERASAWKRMGPTEGAYAGGVDAEGTGFFLHPDGLYRHAVDGASERLLSWDPEVRSRYQATLSPEGRLLVWDNGALLDVEKRLSKDTGQPEFRTVADYPTLRGVGIRAMAMDNHHRLWVSIQGRGLYCLQDKDVLFLMPDMEFSRLAPLNDSLMGAQAHDGLHAFTDRQIRNGLRRLRQGQVVKKTLQARYRVGQADGLLSSIVHGATASGDALWVAHPGGITVLPQSVVFRELPPPNVLLSAVTLNGIDHEPGQPLRFKAEDRNVGFSFSTTSYANSHRVYYRYRLRGFDNMWRETGENYVQYADLPSGDYRFEVQAGLIPNVFSSTVSYGFEIPLPFHRQPIVWGSAVLLALGLLYGVHQYRVRHLVQLERTRTQIAMDLHDDIGSSLMSLSLLSAMARQRSERREEVSPILTEIGHTASTLVDNMSDIVWAIDPMQDTFKSVVERLQGFTQRMTVTSDVDIDWQMEGEIESIALAPRVRRNVYLIVKEALANALKHSGSDRLSVRISKDGGDLVVEVCDQGKGFVPADREGAGYGLRTMRQRAGKSGASLYIDSREGSGTSVTVRCPYNVPA
jgi:signal transduction histidine kinase